MPWGNCITRETSCKDMLSAPTPKALKRFLSNKLERYLREGMLIGFSEGWKLVNKPHTTAQPQ